MKVYFNVSVRLFTVFGLNETKLKVSYRSLKRLLKKGHILEIEGFETTKRGIKK